MAWLDAQEQSRWRRYQYDGPRRQFALCRAALRAVLCRKLGCRNEQLAFGLSQYGKPFATVHGEPAPVSFNVSHSGKHGLVAFAPQGRLGVDIEERVARRNLDVLSRAVFGQAEQAELGMTRGSQKVQLFFKIWTIKEALIKAHGMGFLLDASRFEIPPAMRHGTSGGTFQLPQMPAVRWQVENLGNEHFAAAIARELSRDPDPVPACNPSASSTFIRAETPSIER